MFYYILKMLTNGKIKSRSYERDNYFQRPASSDRLLVYELCHTETRLKTFFIIIPKAWRPVLGLLGTPHALTPAV